MVDGFGSTIFNVFRCTNSNAIEFPLTMGRDFAGTIVHKGMAARAECELGESVWGVVPLHRTGCHAQYVTVDSNNVNFNRTYRMFIGNNKLYWQITGKPTNLEDVDAAALLYVGLTAWSGLFLSGQLGGIAGATTSLGGGQGKRVCILGASGGVGHVALQIAKAENCEIVASCATDAVPLVQGLGVTHVVDYTTPDASEQLTAYGPYDIILDCAGKGAEHATELPWKYNHYVTFTSPLLRNFDQYGLAGGSVRNVLNLIERNVQSFSAQKGLIKWAYFLPAPHAIEYLKRLVERKKVCFMSLVTIGKTKCYWSSCVYSCCLLLKKFLTLIMPLMRTGGCRRAI